MQKHEHHCSSRRLRNITLCLLSQEVYIYFLPTVPQFDTAIHKCVIILKLKNLLIQFIFNINSAYYFYYNLIFKIKITQAHSSTVLYYFY